MKSEPVGFKLRISQFPDPNFVNFVFVVNAPVPNPLQFFRVISFISLCQLSKASSYCAMVPPFSGYQRLKP